MFCLFDVRVAAMEPVDILALFVCPFVFCGFGHFAQFVEFFEGLPHGALDASFVIRK